MTNKDFFELNLYRKVRYYRRVENAPVTLDDLRDYRWRLIQGGIPHTPMAKEELRTIEKWIRNLDRPYERIDNPADLDKVQLAPVFSDKMFESLLPKFIGLITQQSDWVCLFHVMIYDGWMNPVEFYPWVDWLNNRAEAIRHRELVSCASRRKVNKYLIQPSRTKWNIEDYCKNQETTSAQIRNHFSHLCVLLDQISEIFDTIQEKVFTL